MHENRFEDTPLNEFSSRSSRLKGFTMSNITAREHHEKFDPKQTCLDYVPRFELKEERSSSYSFDKLVARKLKVKKSYCANEQNFSIEDHDVNNS